MSNVDQGEIKRFSEMAHSWWDKNAQFKVLHDINPVRKNWVIDASGGNISGKKVLDVGCGGGILSDSLSREGADVLGIDLSEEAIEVAKLHQLEVGTTTAHYEVVSVEDLAKRSPETFDVVTCLEMLEHVPSPESVVRACFQLAKPGGVVLFSTINQTPLSYVAAVLGAEYVLKLIPRGTHDYDKFIEPARLAYWCADNGLEVLSIEGLHYNPFFRTAKIGGKPLVNYVVHAVKQ